MDKKKVHKEIWLISVAIIASVIYIIGFLWFLEPASIYGGGVSGLSQLVRDIFIKVTGGSVMLSLGLLTFIFNIPIFIIGWRGVSKRFVIYSIISVIAQSIALEIIPFVDFSGGRPIEELRLLYALMGGIVTAVPCAFALKMGLSTGGLDILGQYLSFKKNISIGVVTLTINAVLAIACGIIYASLIMVLYAIVRIIISSLVIDRIHNAYENVCLEVTTTRGEEVAEALISKLGRGVTSHKGMGMYTHQEKDVLRTIVSRFEVAEVLAILKVADPKAFITVTKVARVIGYFRKKTIA